MPDPPNDVIQLISLLAWVSEADCRTFEKLCTDISQTLHNDEQREQWRQHSLFKHSSRERLGRTTERSIAGGISVINSGIIPPSPTPT